MRFIVAVAASMAAFTVNGAENPVANLGLADGNYCSSDGLKIAVASKETPAYLGIQMLECRDPKLAGGKLTANSCSTMSGNKVQFEGRFSAAGDTIVSEGKSYKLTPTMPRTLPCEPATENAAAETEDAVPVIHAGHNGSTVEILGDRIVYSEPKSSLRGIVKPGTVLVEGRWAQGEPFDGTAYAFKKGCAPAPYKVTGLTIERSGQMDLVLRGAGPVWKGCDVVGYSEKSPHSHLVFNSIMSN